MIKQSIFLVTVMLLAGCSERPASAVSETSVSIRLDKNSSLWINNSEVRSPVLISDIIGALGTPYRTTVGVSGTVYTWDRLGIIALAYPNGKVSKFRLQILERRDAENDSLPEKNFSGTFSTPAGKLELEGDNLTLAPNKVRDSGFALEPILKGWFSQKVGDIEAALFCKDDVTYRITMIEIYPIPRTGR